MRLPSCLMFLVLFIMLGCDGFRPPASDIKKPTKPSSWHKLRDDFRALVKEAQSGQEKAVMERLEKYLMTEGDLIHIFGQDMGQGLWTGYRDVVAATLRKEAARIVMERVKSGMNQVEIERVGPLYPSRTTRGDKAIFAAMKNRHRMYTVRLHKVGEPIGFRLNGFVFVKSRWRGLFKAYNHFPPPTPPADAGVQ